jgi:CubicO group peptidase (beta-lactamase class C family)
MATSPRSLHLSRRAIFRGGAYAATGFAVASLPFGRQLFAHDVSEAYPAAAALAERYVNGGKVANMLLTFGMGQEDHAHTIARGTLALGGTDKVDEDTLYRIYSMTKPITGMAVMMLIDDGLLGLDQPLYDILPAFRDMQVLVDPDGPLDETVPAERAITIRHMLTHTAGLGYLITSKGPLLKAYADSGIVGGRVSRLPIPGVPPVESPASLAAWAENLAQLPLMYQPGARWSYSASLDLLGRVIEVASGVSFPQFLKDRFFDPLGMSSTYFAVPKNELDRLTANYGVVGSSLLAIDTAANSVFTDMPNVPLGGADLVSSPRDYDRFLRMLLGYGELDGERVMGELAVRIGTSNLMPAAASQPPSWVGEGHGAGGRVLGSTFGWGGAAGTLATVDYGLDMRLALFTQYTPAQVYSLREEYVDALESDLASMRAARAA